jgi:glycerophosphoryl diester phosphodiesterase
LKIDNIKRQYLKAWDQLKGLAKPIIAFECWFGLIYLLLLTPAVGWVLNLIVASSGSVAISNHELFTFFLSLRGVLFLLLSLTFVIVLAYTEQIGLYIIGASGRVGSKISTLTALREYIFHFPSLLRLGLLQGAILISLSLPFIGGLALTRILILGDTDINYYMTSQPWQWWSAIAVASILLITFSLLVAWLYIRWLFAVPSLIFENLSPLKALRKSWQKTHQRFLSYGIPLGILWLVITATGFVFAWLIRSFSGLLLANVQLELKYVLPIVILALGAISGIYFVLAILGKAIQALLILEFYSGTSPDGFIMLKKRKDFTQVTSTRLGIIGWAAVIAFFLATISGGIVHIEGLDFEHQVKITAHRGSSFKSPENTLSALRQAVEDGADYAEIDVQTTADGIVVLLHDGDLIRIAGQNLKIHESTFSEIKEIDIGSWFDAKFKDERIATLDQAIDYSRDRIKLNIELKYNRPDPKLAGKVAQIISGNDFTRECIVTSLDYLALLEIKKILPEVSTGLILFRSAGDVLRTHTDLLSIHASQATKRIIRSAHRQGKQIHVWTVNDWNNAISMIERGVDNIITDKPDYLNELLRIWEGLSDIEKITLMFRNLLLETDPELLDQL